MEKIVLVDSSVFIYLLRSGQDPASVLLERFETLDLATCGMVKVEVLRGVRHPGVKEKLAAFMEVMRFVISDNRLWDEGVELAWHLDRQGRILPAADLMIAASALRIGAEVLTLDKHFKEIPGLSLTEVPKEWKG